MSAGGACTRTNFLASRANYAGFWLPGAIRFTVEVLAPAGSQSSEHEG